MSTFIICYRENKSKTASPLFSVENNVMVLLITLAFARKSVILLWLACTCVFSSAILNTYLKRFLPCIPPSGVLIAHPRLIIGLVFQTHYSDIWNIRMIVALDTLATAFQHFYLWVMYSGQSALIYILYYGTHWVFYPFNTIMIQMK